MLNKRWRIKEHWRRLLAEFFVIAVGVLTAMAVDNWNDTRRERVLEAEYLVGIAADLEATRRYLQFSLEAAQENQAALYALIAIAQGDPPPSAARLTEDLIRATYLGLPRASSITLDELISTGSLRLIRDQAFKRRLAEFYQRIEWSQQFYPEYRRKEAATEAALHGMLLLEARLDLRNIATLPGLVDVERVTDTLRSRASDFIPVFEDSVWTQARVMLGANDALEQLDELLAMLAAMGVEAPP